MPADTYLVYRIGATEVGESDRPFVADVSLLKLIFSNNNPPTLEKVEFATLVHGLQTIPVTYTADEWTGNNSLYNVRFRRITLEQKDVLIGLVTHVHGSKKIIDTFFAQKVTINLELANGTYDLTYAWENSLSKKLTIGDDGTKKVFSHHSFDATGDNDKVNAKNDGPQAPGRFTTVSTDKSGRFIHGMALPFEGKKLILGYVTRPGGQGLARKPDPTDAVEPFVAIAP